MVVESPNLSIPHMLYLNFFNTDFKVLLNLSAMPSVYRWEGFVLIRCTDIPYSYGEVDQSCTVPMAIFSKGLMPSLYFIPNETSLSTVGQVGNLLYIFNYVPLDFKFLRTCLMSYVYSICLIYQKVYCLYTI